MRKNPQTLSTKPTTPLIHTVRRHRDTTKQCLGAVVRGPLSLPVLKKRTMDRSLTRKINLRNTDKVFLSSGLGEGVWGFL